MTVGHREEKCPRRTYPAAREKTARITAGLEPALVDHAPRLLTALEPSDRRQVDLKVAGPAALLVAKAIKVEERLADADGGKSIRLKEKDALDMFRLLQAIETEDLVHGIRRHFSDDQAGEVTMRGLRQSKRMGWTPGLRSQPWLPGQPRETPPSLPASWH